MASLPSIQVLALRSNGQTWTPHTLELLGDAAALARRLSGQLVAWVAPPHPDEGALEALGAHGCDAVYLFTDDNFQWSPEALASNLAENPRVILLPGDSRGEELAALLSGRLDWEWIPDALTLSATRTGSLEVSALLPGGKLSRTYRAVDSPVIVTMREGVAESRAEKGRQAPRVREALSVSAAAAPVRRLEFLPADPRTQDITAARRIVAGGRGTGGAGGMALVAELGNDLAASLAASRMAVDLGWADHERQVGQTGKHVRPELYVACGISGASHHLAGMRESRHIVAINPDARAPIHDVAHLSLRADLREAIPAIRAVLRRRRGNA